MKNHWLAAALYDIYLQKGTYDGLHDYAWIYRRS